MTLTFPFPSLASLLAFLSAPARPNPQGDQIRKDGAGRDFLREKLDECPDAFSSDQGLMALMSVYPREF